MWSLGIVLYEMCTLKCPFDAANLNGLVLKIIRGVYAPLPGHFSGALRELVGQLLTREPKARPSINALLRIKYIKDRIGKFLDASLHAEEFSHTVMHGARVALDLAKPPAHKAHGQGVNKPAPDKPAPGGAPLAGVRPGGKS